MEPGHSHVHDGPDTPLPTHVRRLLAIGLAPFAIATIVATVLLWPAHAHHRAARELGQPATLVNATVEAVEPGECSGGGGQCLTVFLTITSGPDKGDTATLADQSAGPGAPPIHDGDHLVVGRTVDPTTQQVYYYFSDFQRRAPLLLLAALFGIVVVVVARWRGLAAVVGVGITGLVLVRFALPAIIEGKSPVAVSLTAGAIVLFVVLYLA
ncbi:MAG TPA: YibE/F family protein, partial [Acidimicrobiales bacterium]|nr:YibE/F family protein [Acidimicrobiales bacterium]